VRRCDLIATSAAIRRAGSCISDQTISPTGSAIAVSTTVRMREALHANVGLQFAECGIARAGAVARRCASCSRAERAGRSRASSRVTSGLSVASVGVFGFARLTGAQGSADPAVGAAPRPRDAADAVFTAGVSGPIAGLCGERPSKEQEGDADCVFRVR